MQFPVEGGISKKQRSYGLACDVITISAELRFFEDAHILITEIRYDVRHPDEKHFQFTRKSLRPSGIIFIVNHVMPDFFEAAIRHQCSYFRGVIYTHMSPPF